MMAHSDDISDSLWGDQPWREASGRGDDKERRLNAVAVRVFDSKYAKYIEARDLFRAEGTVEARKAFFDRRDALKGAYDTLSCFDLGADERYDAETMEMLREGE
jgi:hypothetical protein